MHAFRLYNYVTALMIMQCKFNAPLVRPFAAMIVRHVDLKDLFHKPCTILSGLTGGTVLVLLALDKEEW